MRFYDRREIRDLDELPQAHRQSRRRRGVPSRGRGAEARPRRHDASSSSPTRRARPACRCSRPRRDRDARRTLRARGARRARRVRRRSSRRFASRRARRPSTSCCATSSRRFATTSICKAEGPEGARPIENVRELITGAAETVADEEGEVGLTPLDHFLQRAMLVAGSRQARTRRRRGDADDAAQREGTRVPGRVHHRARGRALSARARRTTSPRMLEEERRLFYVGITRAEAKLYLTHAEAGAATASSCRRKASSFLQADSRRRCSTQRKTIKVRSSASFMHRWRRQPVGQLARTSDRPRATCSTRHVPPSVAARPGAGTRVAGIDEARSQDAPSIVDGRAREAPQVRQRHDRRARRARAATSRRRSTSTTRRSVARRSSSRRPTSNGRSSNGGHASTTCGTSPRSRARA